MCKHGCNPNTCLACVMPLFNASINRFHLLDLTDLPDATKGGIQKKMEWDHREETTPTSIFDSVQASYKPAPEAVNHDCSPDCDICAENKKWRAIKPKEYPHETIVKQQGQIDRKERVIVKLMDEVQQLKRKHYIEKAMVQTENERLKADLTLTARAHADMLRKVVDQGHQLVAMQEQLESSDRGIGNWRVEYGKLADEVKALRVIAIGEREHNAKLREANDSLRSNLHTAELTITEEGKTNNKLGCMVDQMSVDLEAMERRAETAEAMERRAETAEAMVIRLSQKLPPQ